MDNNNHERCSDSGMSDEGLAEMMRENEPGLNNFTNSPNTSPAAGTGSPYPASAPDQQYQPPAPQGNRQIVPQTQPQGGNTHQMPQHLPIPGSYFTIPQYQLPTGNAYNGNAVSQLQASVGFQPQYFQQQQLQQQQQMLAAHQAVGIVNLPTFQPALQAQTPTLQQVGIPPSLRNAVTNDAVEAEVRRRLIQLLTERHQRRLILQQELLNIRSQIVQFEAQRVQLDQAVLNRTNEFYRVQNALSTSDQETEDMTRPLKEMIEVIRARHAGQNTENKDGTN